MNSQSPAAIREKRAYGKTAKSAPKGSTKQATILHCKEHLRTRAAAAAFSKKIAGMVPRTTSMLLDLTGVEANEAGRLGELVLVLMWAQARGCIIQLTGVDKPIRRVLDELNLGSLFNSYETLQEAWMAPQASRAA